LDAELTHKAHETGLIISKTCENALKQAINRLQGLNTSYIPQNPSDGQNKGMVDGTGFEPATSTMPTWRSCQTDLPAQKSMASEALTRNFNL
jgi:hypothetical protein